MRVRSAPSVVRPAPVSGASSTTGPTAPLPPVTPQQTPLSPADLRAFAGSRPAADHVVGAARAHTVLASRSDAVAAADAVARAHAYHQALGLTGPALAEKEALLSTDAHTFFRGLPALFVQDLQGVHAGLLALTPRPAPSIPILGDFHLGNLGTFRGPKGAVWGPNDYDQVGVGTPELDLLRGATSIALLCSQRGFDKKTSTKAIGRFFRAYASELQRLATGEAHPGPLLTGKALDRHGPKVLHELVERARDRRDPVKSLTRGGAFVVGDALQAASARARHQVGTAITAVLGPTATVTDVVEKHHAGGSSRGLPRFLALVEIEGDRHVLELKLAPPTPLVDPSGATPFDAAAMCAHQATMMGEAFPAFTAPCTIDGRSFLMREVEREKDTLELSTLKKGELVDVAGAAGTVLARLHGIDRARAGELSRWLTTDATSKEARARELDHAGERLRRGAQRLARHVEATWASFSGRDP